MSIVKDAVQSVMKKAVELAPDASPIIVEAVSGRAMTLVPRDVFLATPGYRESTRWVVGGIPKRGGKVCRGTFSPRCFSTAGGRSPLLAGRPSAV